jgi:Integrase core domain
MEIRDPPTSYRSPWQNGHTERLIGSVRRECTDHVIALNAEHLRRILVKYATYYNAMRTHVSLGKDAPRTRLIESLAAYIIDTLESRFRSDRCVRLRGKAVFLAIGGRAPKWEPLNGCALEAPEG